MPREEIDVLLKRYADPSKLDLARAIDAILELKQDKNISEVTARRLVRVLISKYISDEIRADIYVSRELKRNPRKFKFMRLKYGKTEESYA